MVCLMFYNSSLDEQLFLKQQPSALCHWLIDNNRDYVGRREDAMYNFWVRGRAREEEAPFRRNMWLCDGGQLTTVLTLGFPLVPSDSNSVLRVSSQ